MNEWPAGWFRDEDLPAAGAGGPAQPAAGGPAGPDEQTVALPAGGAAAGAGQATGYAWAAGSGGRPTVWPEQPPLRSSPDGRGGRRSGPGYQPPGQPSRLGRRGRFRPRRILAICLVVVLILLVAAGGLYFYLDSKLSRSDVLAAYAGQPAAGAGQNWLITGSDSRQGLTRAQERQLATGAGITGQRSDTIMLLHIPPSGRPLLISLPRDLYVRIPGHGMNKLNAAYSFGGPALLARTVQDLTGLRLEHYMGIGFGGLVNVVNAVGGVRMCLPRPINDRAAGLHLKAGCQTLDGAQALGYVRTRHHFATQDLQRVQNQRLFLAALLRKVTSPGTLLNPFSAVPAALGSADSLSVDSGTHLYQLISAAFALRNPQTTTVPIASANYLTPAGDAVLWNKQQARTLFDDLNAGRPVPPSLISGSQLAG